MNVLEKNGMCVISFILHFNKTCFHLATDSGLCSLNMLQEDQIDAYDMTYILYKEKMN